MEGCARASNGIEDPQGGFPGLALCVNDVTTIIEPRRFDRIASTR